MGCANGTDYKFMDPDISGPGVRISFYLQTFFLVVLVNRSWQDAPLALWTCITMSLALTIAVIANLKFMTLLEVLQVCNLVWLANIGIFVSLASYSRQKAGSRKARMGRRFVDYRVKFGAMFQTMFSMVLTVVMWSRVESIGCLADQRDVQYVFFVWKVQAVGTGKHVGLAFSSLLLTLYVGLSLREVYSFYRNRRKRTSGSSASADTSTSEFKPISPPTPTSPGSQTPISPPPSAMAQRHSSPAIDTLAQATESSVNSAQHRRPKRRRWSSDNLDPMLVGILIIEFLVWTYFVVSCEELISKNDANDGEAAGFGQIVALVVVTPSLLSMIGAIRENGFGRLSVKKKNQNKKSRRGHRSRRRPNGISEMV
ncbi:hypothetical protein V5O48_009045 [Marasmius crinis-equi]|uniref:Uncharacterized protein n=1 Tax=Marasmius crinis-equi TaxID=585013 RepID=A0ABR3FCE5_9AGAR